MSRRVAVARSPEGSFAYYVLSHLSRRPPPPLPLSPSFSLSLSLSPSLSFSRRCVHLLCATGCQLRLQPTRRDKVLATPLRDVIWLSSPGARRWMLKTWPRGNAVIVSARSRRARRHAPAATRDRRLADLAGNPRNSRRARGAREQGRWLTRSAEQNYRLRAQHHHKSQVYGRRRSYSRVR